MSRDQKKRIDERKIITLHAGDITLLHCDCIVNAANSSLLGGGGVDGAIHRAAGKGLLEECKKLHGCAVGDAKITKGHNLHATFVIHTVGPKYSGQTKDEENLKSCYKNSLELAKTNDIHSIAFPGISTGIYHYPVKEATQIAIRTIQEWAKENTNYEMKIILCVFKKEDYKIYENILNL